MGVLESPTLSSAQTGVKPQQSASFVESVGEETESLVTTRDQEALAKLVPPAGETETVLCEAGIKWYA